MIMAGYLVTLDGYTAIGDDINNDNIDDYMVLTLDQVMESTFLADRGDDEVPGDDVLEMTPAVKIKSSDKITVCEMGHDEETKHFKFDEDNCDNEYLLPTSHSDEDIEVNFKYYSSERWEDKTAQKEINMLLKSSKMMERLKDDQTVPAIGKRDGWLLVIGNGDERKMHLFLNGNAIGRLTLASTEFKRRKVSDKSIGMSAGTHTYRLFKWKKAHGDIMGHMGYTIMRCSY